MPGLGTQTHKRIEACLDLGLEFNFKYGSYVLEDVNISTVEITCDTKEEWTTKIAKIKAEIKQRGGIEKKKDCNQCSKFWDRKEGECPRGIVSSDSSYL